MSGIVQEIREKIKFFISDQGSFTALVLILVAITAFGLGRQSVGEVDVGLSDTKLEESNPAPTVVSSEPSSLPSTFYVGSKNGTVYHLPHCSGAKNISEANKITFNTKAEAEAAGYRPAKNCKGI